MFPRLWFLMLLMLSVTGCTENILMQIRDNPSRPQINNFYANGDISLQQLLSGNARIEVGWHALNRTEQMNLVFEQVLPNGNVVNVELPRPDVWVNSEGSGVVAPVYPGDGATYVYLQARLYRFGSGETLDTRTIFVPIRDYVQAPAPTPISPITQPVINYFTVNPTSATEGDALTVSWDVAGLHSVNMAVSIYGVNQPIQHFINESNIATKVLNAPYGVREVTFLIYANDQLRFPLDSVTIPLTCRITWMNGHTSSEYCPETEPQTAQATYQAFERGYMIWRADTGMIWIYTNELGSYTTRPDFYTGETISFDETPPAGMYQPMNGFGKIWVDDAYIRQLLGWAISPEQGYTMTYQRSGSGVGTKISHFTVFTLPNGISVSGMIPSF